MHRVAIIGAGIGAEHAAAFANRPAEFKIATICDLDQARGQALASKYLAGFQSELESVLEDDTVQIIDICLPPHLHVDVTLRALAAGKHVICEKPLATSLADADRVIEAAQVSKAKVFPVFQYRFGTGMAQLQALMASGLAGRCFSGALETHWRRESDYYAVPWRGTWAGEQGGAILCHAIHIHDMAATLLGPISSVNAIVGTGVNEIETEDCAAVILGMKSGAMLTSSVTLGAARDVSRLKLMFEGFTVTSDLAPYAPAAKPWTFEARGTSQSDLDAKLARVAAEEAGFLGFLGSVAAVLRGEVTNHVTLEDARRSVELVTAIYHSAQTGLQSLLPLDQSHPLYEGWRP